MGSVGNLELGEQLQRFLQLQGRTQLGYGAELLPVVSFGSLDDPPWKAKRGFSIFLAANAVASQDTTVAVSTLTPTAVGVVKLIAVHNSTAPAQAIYRIVATTRTQIAAHTPITWRAVSLHGDWDVRTGNKAFTNSAGAMAAFGYGNPSGPSLQDIAQLVSVNGSRDQWKEPLMFGYEQCIAVLGPSLQMSVTIYGDVYELTL